MKIYTPDKTVLWSSDNPAVATVSTEGVVSGHHLGTDFWRNTKERLKSEYDVPAGIKHWRGPLGLGEQRFILKRDGETVIEVSSRMPVVEFPEYKSWSFYSGYAEATD